MIYFQCDYSEGAHPKILEALVQTNFEQTSGYGMDPHCRSAAERLRTLCQAPDAGVYFVVGGTQANLIAVTVALRPHQGVIAAVTGHVNVHEAGAIEATGHKVLALPSDDGKLTAEQIEAYCAAYDDDPTREHVVQPGMVYISQSSEVGTVYSLAELTAISQLCRRRGLWFYLDGARLGYALAAQGGDVTLPDLARLCDFFYLGGTKQGALFGEAMVVPNPALQKDFRTLIKQRGGMLAKGRLLGIQFDVLLSDGLYFALSQSAVQHAMAIRAAFAAKGYPFLIDSPTNQQFPILPNDVLAKLEEKYVCDHWARIDEGHTAVRFCTSWATTAQNVAALVRDIAAL